MTSETDRPTWRERIYSQAYLVTLFLMSVAGGMFSTTSQYIYRRVASSYTDDLTSLANITDDNACGATHVNTSSAEYQLYAKISEETARWNMYLTVCTFTPTIVMILVLGAYSDQVGRRFLFLLSIGGAIAKSILLCLIIYLELHMGFILLAELLQSVTGGSSSLAIASFSYTADQHSPSQTDRGEEDGQYNRGYEADDPQAVREAELGSKAEDGPAQHNNGARTDTQPHLYDKNRAVRLLALECFNASSAGVIQLVNGYFIAYAGFFYLALTATAIVIIDFIYTFVVIQNVQTQVKKNRSILEPFRIIRKAVRQPRKMSSFILCNLAVILVCFGDGGFLRTMPVYQMSPPFCWSSVQIGWFNSEFFFVTLLAVPFLMLLRRSNLSDPTMAGIGSIFNAVGTAVYALANTYSWIFYAMAVMTVPGMLAFALTRTITSRLAGPEAHGAMFAFTSLVENIMYMIGALAGSGVYETTVAKLHSAVFFYFAAIYMTSGLVYFLEAWIERYHPPYDEVTKDTKRPSDCAVPNIVHENGTANGQDKSKAASAFVM